MTCAAVFFIVVYYMQHTSNLDGFDFDVKTVTVQDYTVEMDISNEMWQDFLDNHYEKQREKPSKERMSQALYLKQYLTSQIGVILTKYNENKKVYDENERKWHSGREDYKHELTATERNACEVKVFDIQFAFNNHALIHALKARGTGISNLDFDKVNEQDDKIDALIKDPTEYEHLTKPVCAFITFVTDDGKNAALAYSERGSMWSRKATVQVEKETLFNQEPVFIESTQPTNIIWENRHIKGIDYGTRVLIAFCVMAFMLVITFSVIFFCKKLQNTNQEKWPSPNCNDLIESNGLETIQKYGHIEWEDLIKTKGAAPMFGALKCTCDHETGHKSLNYYKVYNKEFEW